jgi:heme-degrading monooxygenase HmoA
MFASMRRYRLKCGTLEQFVDRVDEGFAEQISRQPGFVSYELVDCGDGEILTISMFDKVRQAEASRELAQRWNEENLGDLDLTRIEALKGEVWVSRARDEMLESAHPGSAEKFASVRRCWLRRGAVWELLHIVDQVFAAEIQRLDGFEAHHVLACGRGELASISLFRDRSAAEESDELALQFLNEHLGSFDIERSEVIGGEVRVSRALAELLVASHA